ncbi:NAD(P)/FAD-dependent oxidoreductase [Aspergillus homomorphus CBS 101889]|uniref:DAO-domain-containing protein n=1 Tax=Aspergillus homomorphus (strain CBS 101889) TaxID=1450537 RepID=A0A395HMC4_ASPHC|nr:DAO-domain-containing protein [Aspergillus homomorphus CBS 101889]RAL08910.1 DAO-domain-containing protein [Aspergillus homomorphus CBS 101889]
MSSESRKLSGQYHLTGADIVESIDDLGSGGRWEELKRAAHTGSDAPQSDTTSTGFTTHKAPDRTQSFRPYEPKGPMSMANPARGWGKRTLTNCTLGLGTEQSEDIHPHEPVITFQLENHTPPRIIEQQPSQHTNKQTRIIIISPPTQKQRKMTLVILGGGIIGLSTAYYAAQAEPTRKIQIVDSASALFQSASGFSGGFIAKDWFSDDVSSLADLSFRLHQQLADAHDGRRKWGYAASQAFGVTMDELDAQGRKTGGKVRGEDWLLSGTSRAEVAKQFSSSTSTSGQGSGPVMVEKDARVDGQGNPTWMNRPDGESVVEEISSEAGCAQVDPKALVEWLLAQCRERRVEILLNTRATGFVRDQEGRIEAVRAEQRMSAFSTPVEISLPCKDVVIAAGCWTPRVFQTLFKRKMAVGINGLAGYSVIVRSPRYTRSVAQKDHSIFCAPGPQWEFAPEMLGRVNHEGIPEIYIAGLNSDKMPLPEVAGDIPKLRDQAQVERLREVARLLTGSASSTSSDLEIVSEGLCFRPVSTTGSPIISSVTGAVSSAGGKVFVASGHGPWGITLALGTGQVVSELLTGKTPSADINRLALQQDVSLVKSNL